MCYKYIKELLKEIKEPKNVAVYIVFFALALIATAIFQSYITPHPKVKIKHDENFRWEPWERVFITNEGNLAAKDIEMRVLYNDGACYLVEDVAENSYLNNTKHSMGIYPGGLYNDVNTMKWILWNFNLNPGVELQFQCKNITALKISISGSNFKTEELEWP